MGNAHSASKPSTSPEKNTTSSTLLQNLGKDLNGLIHHSLLQIEALKAQGLDATAIKHIANLQESTSKIRDLASILGQQGHASGSGKPEKLQLLCENLKLQLQQRTRGRVVDVVIDLPAEADDVFDENDQLHFILHHLMAMLAEYTTKGEITLHVKAPSSTSHSTWHFSLFNDGETQFPDRLDDWQKPDPEYWQQLCLQHVANMLQRWGSTLVVNTAVAPRLHFSFAVNLHPWRAVQHAHQNTLAIEHVLIACGDRMQQQLVLECLKPQAVQKYIAQDSVEAATILRNHSFELVVIDNHFPTEALLNLATTAHQTQCQYLYLGQAPSEAESAFSQMGLTLHALPIPFNNKELLHAIGELGQMQTIAEYEEQQLVKWGLAQLDHDALQNIYEGDREYQLSMFQQFLASFAQTKPILTQLLKNGDKPLLKRELHKLKPSLGLVGLTTLMEEIEHTEKLVEVYTPARMKAHVQQLITKIEQFLPALRAHMQTIENKT